MARLVLIRPVHILPGKEDELLRWSHGTESVRRQWGLLSQMSLRSTIDPKQYLLLQVWESKEAYLRWKASPDRVRLAEESSRMVFPDPTQTYEEF